MTTTNGPGMPEIPYSAEPRPSTGLTNARLGMLLFIASEVMLFGALMTSYVFLRASYSGWTGTDGLPWAGLGFLNTAAMAGSTAAMAAALSAHRRGRSGLCRLMLASAAILGAGFLLVTGIVFREAFAAGIYPSTSTFAAISYVLTGLHAVHVAGGLLPLGLLLGPWRPSSASASARFDNRVAVTGLYWHFLTAVWIVTFIVLRFV
jgi:heme/copper-type cytochrome/quinol oxidase subunit 3